MADEYIKREAVLEIAMMYCPDDDGSCSKAGEDLRDMLDEIESIPSADVRPVVTCEKCKHKGWVQEPSHGKSVDYCRVLERVVEKDYFCGYGKPLTVGADMRGET